MIRLTLESGEPIYFNPDHIKAFTPVEKVTHIYPDEGVFVVTESPEEVASKVLEWRLAMEDFKACLMIHDASTSGAVNKLHNLAGLEEPSHDEG